MNSGDSALEPSNFKLTYQPGVELKFADFLINQVIDAAFCLGEDAQFLYVNKATCCLTEYSREELLCMKVHELDVDFSLHNWLQLWQNLKHLEHDSFKSRYRTKRGRVFLAEVNLRYIKYQDIEFGCAFIQDKGDGLIDLSVQEWIDDGREIKKNLQQELIVIQPQHIDTLLHLRESRFRFLLESINASIFLIQGTQICYVNPAAELLTGYTKTELLTGFDLNQVIKSKKPHPSPVNNSECQEIKILTKDGKERWLVSVMTRLNGVIDFHGQEVEILTAIDITNYKYVESELCQTLEKTKLLSELRAHLVAIVCHQFRTPLNVISFSNSLLKRYIDKWEEEKILPFIKHIQIGVEQINQILDDILLLAKAESVQFSFQPEEIDLVEFCQDLISKMLIINSEYHINFDSRGNCEKVWIDKKLVEPIVNNLLENAIKYSPIGSVVDLRVDCHEEEVIFHVKDQGIAIPEEDQKRLFEPFYRGSNIDKIPGNGLGLSIVKTLVNLHGGQMTVVSKVGVGTTFTVVLPSVPYLYPESS